MKLRIATYNVHKCKGLDSRVSVPRIAGVINDLNADVVALQEVFAGQAERLAQDLGLHWAMGENRKLDGDAYGNAVLSRHVLRSHCNYDVTVPGRESRGCLRTDVSVMNHSFHLFNVHLGTAFFERRRQAKQLVDEAVLRSHTLTGPRIVVGDFNEWTRGHVSQTLTKEFQSTDVRVFLKRVRTYPGILPVMHLDHIYYDPDLRVEHVALHRTRTSLIASDHLPLIADFCLLKA